jgi:pimeloyl-ACP methyl ester carboxylesterase
MQSYGRPIATLVARRFRVATFDLLGQVASDKPGLFISPDDQVATLHLLIGRLGNGRFFSAASANLVAFRDAISLALERRHAEVRKLWTEALEGVGITKPRSE